MTNPFFRLEAPSREITPIRPSSETLTSFTLRASTFTVSIIFIFDGSDTSQKYASPLPKILPVAAKSFPSCSPIPAHTQRSPDFTSDTNPCPINLTSFSTARGTTFTVF